MALGIDGKTFLTQLLGFIVLLLILKKWAFPKVFGMLDQRQADIKAVYDQLDQDRNRMEQSRLEYERKLAGIELEAREQIQAAVKEAQLLRDNLIADAHKQVETILEKGRSDSERERQKAFLEMRHSIVALTVAAAGKVIGSSLDDARHTALVDDFITSVGSSPATMSHGSGGFAA